MALYQMSFNTHEYIVHEYAQFTSNVVLPWVPPPLSTFDRLCTFELPAPPRLPRTTRLPWAPAWPSSPSSADP